MKSLWQELGDRSVVKVGLAYLVAAWLVLQVADIVFPALQLPDLAITLVLALLIVGFPVALAMAWAFDITPDGVRRAGRERGAPDGAPGPIDGAGAAASADPDGGAHEATVEVPDAHGGADVVPTGHEGPPTGHAPSIAVLPFADLSPEGDHEYFCDGLTEELLNVLTRIPGLRVASRTSCFAFKGEAADLPTAARKLRVGHVLEGSVRKSGNRIRVAAQLVEAASDSHLWSETYDRELDDLFAIQDDIAGHILSALELKLGTEPLADPTTDDARAYELFLSGQGYSLALSERGLKRADQLFRRAVEADPTFLRAWIALARVNALRALFLGCGQPCPRVAAEAAERAVQLAPDRPGSFVARGYAHMAAERYDEAERDFLQAIRRDESSWEAHHYLARSAYHRGQSAKALEYFGKASHLNPEDYESPLLAYGLYENRGDAEGALRAARIGVERVERHLADYPDNQRAYYLGVTGLAALGDLDRAHEWAERALALDPDDPPTRYNLACFYARMDELDRALDCLEGSIHSRSWMQNDPDLLPLHGHPRFEAILNAMSEDDE